MRFAIPCFTLAALSLVAESGLAQQPKTPPTSIPIFQPTVPNGNAYGSRLVVNPSYTLPGPSFNTPGTAVYVPPRYVGTPGSVYWNNPSPYAFGAPSGGFQGMTASNGQFYSVYGGSPAPTNPFVSNVAPIAQTWPNTTGVNGYGPPWQYPFQGLNNNLPQYPMIMNAPVVGQSNGLFQPAQPVGPPNNFGVQIVPGIR